MKSVLALLLAAVLALPTAAQIVPDEMPDHAESMADRLRRDLVERHRPFLSGLYSEATLAAGPVLGAPAVAGAATLEGGYRFESGHAVAVVTTLRSPLEADLRTGALAEAWTGVVGAQVSVAARRLSDAPLARRAEVGLGGGASVLGAQTALVVEMTPRVVLPLSPTTSLPVGLRISQEIGGGAHRGPFVGVSLGLRRIWADAARITLE